jgi:hypothetical protein
MDNKTAIETFNVVQQLDHEKGMPIKFEYGLCRIRTRLEAVVKTLQDLQAKKLDGQEDYEKERLEILEKHAKKDEDGKAITKPIAQGVEYAVEDKPKLGKAMAKLEKKFEDTLAALKQRREDFAELLDADVEDFEPYKINVKYIPVKDGLCTLSVEQLRYLMPFLDGDIEDLPDCE